MNNRNKSSPSLTNKVMGGVAVMAGLRMTLRLLGLISVSITARILTPEDFGVVGTAAIAFGFFHLFGSIGIDQFLIRVKTINEEILHTVWTLRLLIALPLAAAVFFSAGSVAKLLMEPRAESVLQLMSIMPVLNALTSPAPSLFARRFQFGNVFWLRSIHKIIAASGVIIMALLIGDYRGLIYGQLIGAVSLIFLTQLFMPYLPKPGLKRIKDIAGFSFWSFWQSVASYITRKADEVVVRRISTTDDFAFYHVTRDMSRNLITEMIAPAKLPLLSGLSKIQHNAPRFNAAVTLALGSIALVSLPIGFGFALIAQEFVIILLGNQWVEAVDLFQYLAPAAAFQAMSGFPLQVYAAINKQHLAAMVSGLRAVFLVVACVTVGVLFGTAEAVAITFTLICIASTVLEYALLYYFLGIPYPLIKIFRTPVISAMVMVVAVVSLPDLGSSPILFSLLMKLSVGIVSYLGMVFLLWVAMGRPEGIEKKLFNAVRGMVRMP